jgi:hypothetical protein
MSKYIIELDYDLQRVVGVGVKQGTVWVKDYDVDDLEELCADYINEHFGDLQDTAYKRGFEDGKASDDKGCMGCAYVGLKESDEPCVRCSKCYKNRYQPKKKDDEIKVGDEVRWGMDLIVITRLYMDGGFKWCDGISKDGIAFHVLEENVSKTNRHFDIAKILEEMKA